MPITFGADPNTLSLDDLLRQLGIHPQGAQQPQEASPQPAPSPQMQQPQSPSGSLMFGGSPQGGVDGIHQLLSGGSGSATGVGADLMSSLRSMGSDPGASRQQSAPDAQQSAADPLPAPPAGVYYGKRGVVGDVLDQVFLGGAIERVRANQRSQALANFELQRASAILGKLSPSQQVAFLTNAPELGKAFAERSAPHILTGGQSLAQGEGGGDMLTAPSVAIDNGRIYSATPTGARELGYTGPQYLANGLDARGGGQVPVASSPVVPFGSRPHDVITAGNTRPNSGGAWFGSQAGPAGNSPPDIPSASDGGASDPLAALPRPTNGAATVRALAGAAPPSTAASGLAARWNANGVPAADQSTLMTTARLESGVNPKVRNNGSSTGIFQFHPRTFSALGGSNINDPGQQADAAAALLQQNRSILSRSLGRPPQPAELYLAHQQGAKGATALLTADPDASAVQTLVDAGVYRNPAMARRAITGNFGTANMTAGQFTSMWQAKFGRSSRSAGQADFAPSSADRASAVIPAPFAQGRNGSPGHAPTNSDYGSGGRSSGGFFGASDTPLGELRTPNLLPEGDPRMRRFAPGAAVEDDGIGHLKVLEGTGYNPGTLSEIYSRNTKDVAPYTEAVPLIRAARQASQGQSGASDISLAEAAARLFNPKASVRQGSLKMFFDDTQGIPDIITGALAQLRPGDANARFTPATRGAIMQMVEQRASILRQSAEPIIQAQQQFAARNKINPGDILPPIEEAGPPPRSGGQVVTLNASNPNADFARLQKGDRYRGPDGVVRTK